MEIKELLTEMVSKKSSDLHLRAGNVPIFRIDGSLVSTSFPVVSDADMEHMVSTIMDERQRAIFRKENQYDFAYEITDVGRFRVNIFLQRGQVKMVLRAVSSEILKFDQLFLPPVLGRISDNRRGLVLVTGTTGSGKSTTLAAMINHINSTRSDHIVTIEDPIEFVFKDKKSIISQREVGFDTPDYKTALKHVVRQDPDVILIGEMRDLETTSASITAAQTGHLVLSTLHTTDTIQTVSRIVDLYPPYQQTQVRYQLADSLKAVISQRLLVNASGKGRVPAVEILVVTSLVKTLIADNNMGEIRKAMEKGDYYGMQTFNQSLERLYQQKMIKLDDALAAATNPEEFMLHIKGIDSSSGAHAET